MTDNRFDRRRGAAGRFRAVLGLAAAVAVVSAGGARADAAGAPPAPRWVSSDAVIYAELPHPGALLDRASDGRLLALYNTVPNLKAALDSPDARKLRDGLKLVAGKLGKTWDEAVRDLTAGGVVLAVEAVKGKSPGSFLIVTPNDAAFLKTATAAVVEFARKDAADNGRPDPIKAAEHRGVVGYQVGPNVSYAVVEGRLVIADRSETLTAVIDRALDGLPTGRSVETVDAWKARRAAAKVDTDTGDLAWGLARLDRLREIDPKRFTVPATPNTGTTLLFGGWLATLRQAAWLGASLTWTDRRLAAELTMPAPTGPRGDSLKGFLPPAGSDAPKLVNPPGTVLSVGLWRDLSAVWDARAELFKPEDVQNFAKLDTFAGQFFGGRDFGSGVLGATTSDWRLVVALQDPKALKPVPDVKLPAFALVFDIKPDDDDFAQRLRVAFQSFVGLANLGAAQSKAPPLELLSETYEGVAISTTRFMPAPAAAKDGDKAKDKAKAKEKDKEAKDRPEPVHTRHNFSPSAAQVGRHFVISSSAGLARDLVTSLKADPKGQEEGTLVAEADGAALARLVALNRQRLVMQNVLEKGNDPARAEGEIDLLAALRYLGHGRLSVKDGADLWRLSLGFDLGK